MSKLPVIQVATMNNGGSLAKDPDGFGLFHEHDNMGQFEMGFVLYEPMVGRCDTCARFMPDRPLDLPSCYLMPTAPADGSGFCSEHIERKGRPDA